MAMLLGTLTLSIGWVRDVYTNETHRLVVGETKNLVPNTGEIGYRFALDLKTHYQEVLGFGLAVTECSAYNYAQLSDDEKARLMEAVWGQSGLRLGVSRLTLGSTQSSRSSYQYISDTDTTLATFSFDREDEYVSKMVKDALKVNPNIKLFASPWSPPKQFKSNKQLEHGGRLLDEYYDIYGKYFAKYLQAYLDEGVSFWAVTMQNEPSANASYESCLYTGEEEGKFAIALRQRLNDGGFKDVKIFFWDDHRFNLQSRADATMSISGALEALDGVAVHFQSDVDDYEGRVDYVLNKWPKLLAMASEISWWRSETPYLEYEDARMYAVECIADLKHGYCAMTGLNVAIDTKGGPSHNYYSFMHQCAPIIVDTEAGTFSETYMYAAMAHFSKYIDAGARRIRHTVPYESSLFDGVGVQNPDGSVVFVVLNQEEKPRVCLFQVDGKEVIITIGAKSIHTLIFTAYYPDLV